MLFINGFFILMINAIWRCNVEFSISFAAKILTISSISALFLLLLFLLFPLLPIDFGAGFKAIALTDAPHFDRLNHSTNSWSFPHFSVTAMPCLQIFVLLSIQLLSDLKDPAFPEETQKGGLQTQQQYRNLKLRKAFSGLNYHSSPKTWLFQTLFQEH